MHGTTVNVSGNLLPTFRDKFSVPSSRVKPDPWLREPEELKSHVNCYLHHL